MTIGCDGGGTLTLNAFYAALSRSLGNGLVIDEQTAVRIRAADAAVRTRG